MFLLGECDEPLATEIEERLFLDDALLEQMQRVKGHLLEKHVAGTLSAGEDRALTLQLRNSPRLQSELGSIGSIGSIRSIQEQRTPPATARPRTSLTRRWGLEAGLGLLAASLVLVFLLRTHTVPDAAERAESGLRAGSSSPAAVKPAVPAAILFLPASVLRGGGQAGPRLTVPDLSLPVELQVELREHGNEPQPLSAALFRDGRLILTSVPAARRSEGPVQFLSVPIPAGILVPGDFRIVVTRSSLNGNETSFSDSGDSASRNSLPGKAASGIVERSFTLRQN